MTEDRFEKRAFDAFNEKFEEVLPKHNYNYREAFEEVNLSYQKKVDFLIYSNYETFKNARSRNRRKRRRLI